jgi:hypothetical protein
MEAERAARVVDDWVWAHVTVEAPSKEAIRAVADALALVPEPEAVAAVTRVDGRPRIAALAGAAVYLVWAVPASAGTPEAARCRRIPLDPAGTAVELSERGEIRHWSFEIDDEPLVFRTGGDDEPERFARALASALGWPQ